MAFISRNTLLLLALVCAFAISGHAEAQSKKDAKLEVGSMPPAISSWGTLISGETPSSKFGNGKTVVVEFWATWCAPCRKSIPHLNQLYQTLKTRNVEMIGISDESEKIVRDYVRKKGPGMSYSVVSDPSGKMNDLWMKPAGAKGIPTAFIVGPTGRIAYIGHPLDPQFDRVLFLCSEGRYDPTLMNKAKPYLDAAERSIKSRDWRQAHRQIDEVIKLDNWVFSDQVERKYRLMIESQGMNEEAFVYLDGQVDVYASKADVLNDFVRMMVLDPDLPKVPGPLMEKTIAAFAQTAGEDSPRYLVTMALVAQRNGRINEAVDLQFKAWMSAESDQKPALKSVLDGYKSEQAKGKGSGRGKGGRR